MIAGILQLPDLRGQAGLDARREVPIGPRLFIALQHTYRGRVGSSANARLWFRLRNLPSAPACLINARAALQGKTRHGSKHPT